MNIKNNKGFSLPEVAISVIIFSIIVLSSFSILSIVVNDINSEAILKKINILRSSVNTDI
jgi:prepilin-type N-terminal cleavage/methylation domain-containing protein